MLAGAYGPSVLLDSGEALGFIQYFERRDRAVSRAAPDSTEYGYGFKRRSPSTRRSLIQLWLKCQTMEIGIC